MCFLSKIKLINFKKGNSILNSLKKENLKLEKQLKDLSETEVKLYQKK